MNRDDFTALMQFVPSDPAQDKVDVRRDFILPEHGAATQVWAAVSADLTGVGSMYLADCRIQDDMAPYAIGAAHALALWDVLEKLCGGESHGRVVRLRSYDDRCRDDGETPKALGATVELLREVPYSEITMRAISKRAGASIGSLRAHFWSTDAIVAEIYLERLRAAPLDVELGPQERIATQFSHLVMCWR